MNLHIKGLFSTYLNEEEKCFFYNDKLLADNVIIQTEYLINDEAPTMISVKHYGELEVGEWIFYWGDYLEPIQEYRIIKDIFDLYNEHSLVEFVQILDDLTAQSMSVSMQSDDNRKEAYFEEVKAEMEVIKDFLRGFK